MIPSCCVGENEECHRLSTGGSGSQAARAKNTTRRPRERPWTAGNSLGSVLTNQVPVRITDSALSSSNPLRGSAELLEESGGNVSPAESMTSIPTCMPFSWFGDKDRDRDRDRDREPSSSSSSLPYAATETSSEQSQDRRNKVSPFRFGRLEDVTRWLQQSGTAGSCIRP